MALAYVVIGFVESLQGLGTGRAVVQRKEVSDDLLSSVFHLNLVAGAILTAAVYWSAGPVASLFSAPELAPILRVLSGAILIASSSVIHRAVLMRQMSFDRIAKVTLWSALAHAVVAISLATAGFGVWALVAGYVAETSTATFLFWFAHGWRPRAHFASADVRSIARFSGNFAALRILSYWVGQADRVLIGKFLGAGPLGIYTITQRLTVSNAGTLQQAIEPVLFARLSSLQEHPEKMQDLYLRTTAVAALMLIPAMMGLAIVAEPLVIVLLGEAWRAAVPLVTIFALVGILNGITGRLAAIYEATGRTDLHLRWGIFRGVLIIVSFIVGLRWGIMGVAVCYALVRLMLTPPAMWLPYRLIGIRFSDLLRALAPCLVSTMAMAGAVWLARETFEGWEWSPQVVLSWCVGIGVAIYAALIWGFRPPALADLRHAVAARGVDGADESAADR